MRNGYRPSLLDHLPSLRRGHGSKHDALRLALHGKGRYPLCVQPTCCLMLPPSKDGGPRGELHDDQKANAADWKIEHGFCKVDRRTGEMKALDIPFEECFR